MRVLFSSSAGVGHLLPILGLAEAAVAAGHDVRVGVGASLGPIVERAGLAHVALGPASLLDVRAEIPGFMELDGPARAARMYETGFGRIVATAMAREIVELARTWRPALIVHEDMEMGSPVAAERLGIPHVTIQAAAWRPHRRPVQVDNQNAIRREHGLPPSRDLAGFDGQMWITNRPPALRDPSQPMPTPLGELRPGDGDRAGAEAVSPTTPWLDSLDGRPLVAVTLGTVQADRVDLLRPIVDGLATLEVDVVVGLGADPSTLGPVAGNVRVERYVPMSDLLPRSAVTIHHAGSGTTLAALAAGVPSLLVPIAADQPENAAAVVRAGAGRALDVGGLSAAEVAAAVRTILDDATMIARARTIAEEIAAMPDAAAAWALIETDAVHT